MKKAILRCVAPPGAVLSLEDGDLVIQGKQERRTIPAEGILGIRLEPPMGLSRGKLRVTTAQGEEEFSFRRSGYVQAATLQGQLSGLISRMKTELPQEPTPVSLADELVKLKGLLDSGALTPEEFERAKGKQLH